MADGATTNYGFVLPEVNSSDDTWGDKLNQNWVDVDTQLNTIVGRTISAGDGLTGGGDLSANRTLSVDSTVVRTTRTLTAGDGLSGGGDLSLNRSFAVDSTVVRTTRSVTAGNGLSGGGALSADRTLTLGTPGTLTGGTTNSVTASSHTHSISSTTSRTSTSTTTLLAASAMNDHRSSSDHDGRYYQKSEFSTADTASTPVIRDTAGDVRARLFRSTYTTTNSSIAAIYTTQDTTGTDFMRMSTPAQVMAAIGGQRTITAGNGLSGGGDLSSNRTISLGTPGTIVVGSTNSATATSHTHAVNATNSRTATDSTLLFTAAGMNNHRLSGDHDGRYYTKALVDDRRETVNAPGYGTVVRTKQYKYLYFQVPMTVSQELATTGKVEFTTDTGLASNGTTAWYFPSAWWDTTNHRFIAPVDGLYHLYAQVYRSAVAYSNVAVNISFRVNGATINGPQGFGPGPGDFVDGDNTYTNGRLDMTLYLTAGDYVEVWQQGGQVTLLGSVNDKASYFGGFLL